MKILCFILSFYVLFLASAPCCLEEKCSDEIKTAQSDNHSQDYNDNDCNACSPFFTCGTCSGFVFTKIEVNFKEVDFIKTNFVEFYKSPFANNFFAKIWQPPKIS